MVTLLTRVRRDITYPGLEPNHQHNCTNMLTPGMTVSGLCAHPQPLAPAPHHRVLPPHSGTATHPPPPGVLRHPFSFGAPHRASGAVVLLPACASCLGPTTRTFAEFT